MTDEELMGMTGKKESGATWHSETVVLREDIYRQALARESTSVTHATGHLPA